MMVKVLLLEQWYVLSDPQMEEALRDRISFRRFVGLDLQDHTPDHSTISRFRTALGEKLSEEPFLELERQLRERGVVLEKGTLMDATLVEARVRRPSLKEGRGTKSPTDPDAEWILLSPWEAGPFGLQGAYWGRSRVGPSEARRRSLQPRYTRARWPTIW